jgi:hypothetical protein
MGYEGFNGTLSYSEAVSGWPSFYSFDPDFMIGMNNYFYSFKGGNLYRHNSEASYRNTFYYEYWNRLGLPQNAYTNSYIQGVFNDSVLENKLFKTIVLQGTDAWEANLRTDLIQLGYIESNWFEKKESDYFSFIRNIDNDSFYIREASGIGNSTTVDFSDLLSAKINFSINPLITFNNLSIGDKLFADVSNTRLIGVVTEININYPRGINQIVLNSQYLLAPYPLDITYFLYSKNMTAESQGVLGHYCIFELSNYNTNATQLFTVGTEVMKSFP